MKPRHPTSSTSNKLYSVTHGLMIRDRLPTAHLAGRPPKPLHDITPSAILPSDSDKATVHEAFTRLLGDTRAEKAVKSVKDGQRTSQAQLFQLYLTENRMGKFFITFMQAISSFECDVAWSFLVH